MLEYTRLSESCGRGRTTVLADLYNGRENTLLSRMSVHRCSHYERLLTQTTYRESVAFFTGLANCVGEQSGSVNIRDSGDLIDLSWYAHCANSAYIGHDMAPKPCITRS